MADVLLVNYPGYPRYLSCLMPDNGLASLAAVIREDEHNVIIHDYATADFVGQVMDMLKDLLHSRSIPYRTTDIATLRQLTKLFAIVLDRVENMLIEDLCHQVRANDIDVVGFKMWAGRSSVVSGAWAGRLKAVRPNLRIVCGGPQVTIFRDSIRNLPCFRYMDAVFVGEAECPFKDYLSAPSSRISGDSGDVLILERQSLESTDRARDVLPVPEYQRAVYPSMNRSNKLLVYLIEDSIGCPNECAFCNRKWMYPSLYIRNAQSVWRRIRNIHNKYGANVFKLAGANTPAKLLQDLAETQNEQKFQFMCFGDFREYSPATVEQAWKLGVRWIFFGLESASEDLLERSYGKSIDPAKASEVIEACRDVGISTTISLIYPGPHETKDSKRQTLQWLERVRPSSVTIQMPSVLCGTKWFRNPSKYSMVQNCENATAAVFNQDHHDGFYLPFGAEEQLPFLVNGWSHKRTCQEIAEVGEWVMERFPLCTEDYLACAQFSGYGNRQTQFNQQVRNCFYGGDTEYLRNLLLRINNKIISSHSES